MQVRRLGTRRPVDTRVAIAALAALTVIVVPGGARSAAEASATTTRWAPASRATITPGVQMYTKGAQCTGNFVFRDAGGRVYVGYAAHCAGLGSATDTNGCRAKSLPLGTAVRFAERGTATSTGSTVGRGRLAYSSWIAMQRLRVRSTDRCLYNDFALVRVGRKFVARVNPSVPFWGGPTGLSRAGTDAGDKVYGYGASSLRAGVDVLSPKTGVSLGDHAHGWTRQVYTASPGIPGDSGSGFLGRRGRALGVLSTLTVTPTPGSNGVGDLAHELRFARRHSGIASLHLVRGTRAFSPLL